MKKLLLSAASLAVFLSVQAQPEDLAPGFHNDPENGNVAIYDDFEGDPYGGEEGGIYWWGEDDLEGGDNPGFQALLDRETDTDGTLNVTVSQAQGEYVPFGVSFGEDAEENPVSLDFSEADFTYHLSVTNESVEKTIVVRLSAQDINGNLVDADSSWNSAAESVGYNYNIEVTIEPLETKVITAGVDNKNNNVALSGSFRGAFEAAYPETEDFPDGQCEPVRNEEFDPSQVTEFLITVYDIENTEDANRDLENGECGYEPFELSEVEVVLNYFAVGTSDADPTSIFSKKSNERTFNIYPNPTEGGVVNLTGENGEAITNVSVYDAQGNVIESADKMETLNTEAFHSGFYIIKSDQGRQRLIVK